jgi:hypothetical protein
MWSCYVFFFFFPLSGWSCYVAETRASNVKITDMLKDYNGAFF